MSTSDDALLQEVIDIIAEVVEIPVERVTPDKSLVKDLEVDSLTMAETVVALQDRFRVEISDEKMLAIVTVQDVVSQLESAGATV